MLSGLSAAAGLDTSTKAGQAQAKMEEDLNQFLNLLVTQLQNQDPLEPLDANEFTAQLVQFASVEQQIYQNSNLEKMLEIQQTGQAGTMVSYIGRRVEAQTNEIPLMGGLATGAYEHGDVVYEATITIQDKLGEVVFTAPAKTEAGKHGFNWDGKDMYGVQLPDGEYSFTVSAKNRDGDLQNVSQTSFGQVTGVSAESGKIKLSLMGIEVPLEDILTVQ